VLSAARLSSVTSHSAVENRGDGGEACHAFCTLRARLAWPAVRLLRVAEITADAYCQEGELTAPSFPPAETPQNTPTLDKVNLAVSATAYEL